jgi:hypothetical protein
VLHAVEHRLRLGVLNLEARHDEGALPVRVHDERDRPLRRGERKAGVVEDVVRVEQDEPAQTRLATPFQQRVAAAAVLVRGDRDGRDHDSRA